MTETVSKDAYLKAQKQRNLMIGLALAAFVVLVYFVSQIRTEANLKAGAKARSEAAAASSAS